MNASVLRLNARFVAASSTFPSRPISCMKTAKLATSRKKCIPCGNPNFKNRANRSRSNARFRNVPYSVRTPGSKNSHASITISTV